LLVDLKLLIVNRLQKAKSISPQFFSKVSPSNQNIKQAKELTKMIELKICLHQFFSQLDNNICYHIKLLIQNFDEHHSSLVDFFIFLANFLVANFLDLFY